MSILNYLPSRRRKQFEEELGITDPEGFAQASDHPYQCTCDKCKKWWALMGPDPDTGKYGPFTIDQIEATRRRLNG